MNASIISVNHIVSQMFKNSEVPRVESRLTTRKAEMKAIETIASSLPFYFVDGFET
jgi:hypothetical protein